MVSLRAYLIDNRYQLGKPFCVYGIVYGVVYGIGKRKIRLQLTLRYWL